MTKHSPGPWSVHRMGGSVDDSTNQGIAIIYKEYRSKSEVDANALLVAAAPDMFEFLEELENQPGILHEDNVKIKRLIKQAKGEL